MSTLLRFLAVAGLCTGPAVGQWSTSTLSLPRQSQGAAATAARFYFAGGCNALGLTDVVDVYDVGTASWSQLNLSQTKDEVSVAVAGDWVLFAVTVRRRPQVPRWKAPSAGVRPRCGARGTASAPLPSPRASAR